jgi:2-oxoisovalerate dehydrogenase E2 component (dihydrolipoyl transacylase)
MSIFHLPDLGEGLAEAEIHEWFVKVGDTVKVDQPLVSMETAKAVVEVPSPEAGKIKKLYGKNGDIIQTHAPLVEFEGTGNADAPRKDKGTVVGNLEESATLLDEGEIVIGTTKKTNTNIKAMPAVRTLAKQLNVDLASITPSGKSGEITLEDVKNASSGSSSKNKLSGNVEVLHGVRRIMAQAMSQSHQEVVPVTIIDDADVTTILKHGDFTIRLIQAVVAGVKAEPALNVWFDGKHLERCIHSDINIGLAMDTQEGLFVPVLKKVSEQSTEDLRNKINEYKSSVKNRSIAPSDLQGATITLSNFGTIAGRYANPIIVPPMVAILGCGKLREEAVVRSGEIVIRTIAPLSLTFDHRAATGGEATRFLAAVIKYLEGN